MASIVQIKIDFFIGSSYTVNVNSTAKIRKDCEERRVLVKK